MARSKKPTHKPTGPRSSTKKSARKKPRAATAPRRAAATRAAAASPTAFTGFAREAPGFFHRLAAEMTREWFTAHKHEYEALWVEPLTALMADVAARSKAAFPGLTVNEPKLFRIYRDVRFAKDKAPYKTHAAAVIGVSRGRARGAKPTESSAALYMHLGADDEYVGAGRYVFEPEVLVRWRKLVADPRTGAAVVRLIDEAKKRGMKVEAHEVLARVPKPYPPDHPRAELLRHKGLIVGFPAIPRGLIHQARFADWLVARVAEAAPLVTWLTSTLA